MKNTWTCHICGKERPDEKISVLTYPLKDFVGAECNVRYCNNTGTCYARALVWKEAGKFPRE